MGLYNFIQCRSIHRNDQSDVCTKSNRINIKVKHEMLQSKRKDTAEVAYSAEMICKREKNKTIKYDKNAKCAEPLNQAKK